MITKENLNEIRSYSKDGIVFMIDNWEHEYNIKSQELWHINDGVGEPTFLCKVTDFEKLKELLNIV